MEGPNDKDEEHPNLTRDQAEQVRKDMEEIAKRFGGKVTMVEINDANDFITALKAAMGVGGGCADPNCDTCRYDRERTAIEDRLLAECKIALAELREQQEAKAKAELKAFRERFLAEVEERKKRQREQADQE